MKKSVVPAKSRGAVVFAFNTDIDYIKIAVRTARLINHVLKLPVSLITDQPVTEPIFDQVILSDNQLENYRQGTHNMRSWRNGGRYTAYALSPYDETLLLDSDYLVTTPTMLKLFEQEFDYRIMTHNQRYEQPVTETMGTYSLQYQWATVILFRKTSKAEMLFDLAGRIQRNYLYYMNLYNISRGSFRNDFAFTIANNMLNGYDQGWSDGIPWSMLTLSNTVKSMTINNGLVTVKELDRAYVMPQQDLHVMDKYYLLSQNFADFVETVCLD
jgi:hypothetical protein